MRPVRMSPPTSASHDAGLKLSAIAAAATTTATLVAVSSTKRRAATTSRARRPATTRRRSPCSGAHDEDADESGDEGDGEFGHLRAVQRLHRRRNPDAVGELDPSRLRLGDRHAPDDDEGRNDDEQDRHQRPPQLVAKGHRRRRRRRCPLPDHYALLVRAVNQKAASAAAIAPMAKMATAACSGWAIPLLNQSVANATALTVAASRSAAEMRAIATRNAPRPALARRRSAPRDELTWKKPSAPDRNAAAQPALIAVAERLASVPPSASAKVPKTPAKINTKKAGTATSNASVSGARSCSRTKLPLVAASALMQGPPRRPSVRRRGRGGRAR